MLRMIGVLAGISLLSGAALGGLYEATHELAENNVLRFKKIPALVSIFETTHDPLDEAARSTLETSLLETRALVDLGAEAPLMTFTMEDTLAFEAFGQGFGGELGVMVGFEPNTDQVAGIGITTMAETPGLGTRVTEPTFVSQFAGQHRVDDVKVKKDGGTIDAITGATISSRAVCEAVRAAMETYREHKDTLRSGGSQP
jgi:electron transport complex protein RnfG